MGTLTRNSSNMCGHHGPPSPCPSEHMPYSSASSSLSEGSSGHRSHEDDISIVTGIHFILFSYIFYLFIFIGENTKWGDFYVCLDWITFGNIFIIQIILGEINFCCIHFWFFYWFYFSKWDRHFKVVAVPFCFK